MSELRTDFKDDVLDVTQNEKRKYRVIHNEDGTISLEDATVYIQQGDSFGANELNEMNRMANQMNEAAGEILTMADDIDTLQEDVEILKGNDSTMIWDISEELYSESRDVSTLPRDITNGYVVKLNDTFYMIGGDTNAGTPLSSYKYVDTEWVEDTVLGKQSMVKKFFHSSYGDIRNIESVYTGGVVSNNSSIYFTNFSSRTTTNNYCQGTIKKYDGTSVTSSTYHFGVRESGYYLHSDIGISPTSNGIKVLGLAYSNNYRYRNSDLYGLNIGTTTSGTYTTLDSRIMGAYSLGNERKIIQPLCQGVMFNGYHTFLVSVRDVAGQYQSNSSYNYYEFTYKYYIVVISNDKILKTINLPNDVTLITDMVCINDYIYITYTNGEVWRYKNKWEKVNIGLGSLVEHNGEIHRFTGTSHTACKLYREAKTYAHKGTKIYLPYETTATSANLQPIEGGYVVTESGNVELKIYDY